MKTKKMIRLVFFLLILILIPVLLTAGEIKTQTLMDMAGRRVVIKYPVNTIVTTFKPASLCVLSLGLAGKLVGIDNSSRQDRMQQAVFPGVVNITGVGSKTMGINFETLVSLKPDLVILYSQKDGLALSDRLDAMKIPSIVIMPETFATIKASLHLIALAAGEEHNSRLVVNQMDRVLDAVDQRLAGLLQEDQKTGYFASAQGIFSTTTGNMLQDEIFSKAGVKNVSSHLRGYFQNISPEQLVKWNPDIMVLSQHMKTSATHRLFDNALKEITAVSQKADLQVPVQSCTMGFSFPLSVLASLWMAQKAYPKRFLDVDIITIADEFHQVLFGKTMTQMGGTLSDSIE